MITRHYVKSINTRKPMAFRSLLNTTAPLPANCKRLNNWFIIDIYVLKARLALERRQGRQLKPILTY